MAGYSSTPLAKKLGIKPGNTVRLINPPAYYSSLFTDMPADVVFTADPVLQTDLIHFFTTDLAEIVALLPDLKKEITSAGIIWVSWPKKAAKVPTNVTEDLIRNIALEAGLVDVKVCAVDDVWSGLKLVIRLKDRK